MIKHVVAYSVLYATWKEIHLQTLKHLNMSDIKLIEQFLKYSVSINLFKAGSLKLGEEITSQLH